MRDELDKAQEALNRVAVKVMRRVKAERSSNG
jgi:hypothetical protein